MKTVGIIAEYNPFHNGHKFHIEKAKELTGADCAIVIMSGDFVQRGEPACIDKYARVEAALQNGADAVFELPHYYALGNAEHFAMGAVAMLDKLGITDAICFGSECGDVKPLHEIAEVLSEEPLSYQTVLKAGLKKGMTYPAASAAALIAHFNDEAINDTISQPNNILGIYYMKALLTRGSSIKPYTLLRHGNHYHDNQLNDDDISNANVSERTQILSSALSIRNSLDASGNALADLSAHMPDSAYSILQQKYGISFPIVSDDFTEILGYRLLNEREHGFADYIDVSDNLSDRIVNEFSRYTSLSDFCNLLKTKDFTYARVNRALMHIMLGMHNDTLAEYIRNDYIAYARLLGFKNDSSKLLTAIKEHASVPLISKLADAKNTLSQKAYAMLQEDVYASHVYQLAVASKFHTTVSNEYTCKIVKI